MVEDGWRTSISKDSWLKTLEDRRSTFDSLNLNIALLSGISAARSRVGLEKTRIECRGIRSDYRERPAPAGAVNRPGEGANAPACISFSGSFLSTCAAVQAKRSYPADEPAERLSLDLLRMTMQMAKRALSAKLAATGH